MPGKTKKAAFVTGGAKRIGRATAIALAKAGYDIALHYNKSKADAEIVAREISNMGRTCKLFSSNFNDFSKISDLVSDIFNAFPNCNVLVNSVSIFIPARFPDTTPELFDQTINVNFKVPFFLSREFASRCEKGISLICWIQEFLKLRWTILFTHKVKKRCLILPGWLQWNWRPKSVLTAFVRGSCYRHLEKIGRILRKRHNRYH